MIRVFATNSNFLIPNFLQRDGVNLWYFKLKLFDYIVWNIQDLYDAMLGAGKDKGIRKIEFVAKTQFLYAEKEWDLKKNETWKRMTWKRMRPEKDWDLKKNETWKRMRP